MVFKKEWEKLLKLGFNLDFAILDSVRSLRRESRLHEHIVWNCCNLRYTRKISCPTYHGYYVTHPD